MKRFFFPTPCVFLEPTQQQKVEWLKTFSHVCGGVGLIDSLVAIKRVFLESMHDDANQKFEVVMTLFVGLVGLIGFFSANHRMGNVPVVNMPGLISNIKEIMKCGEMWEDLGI